MTPIMVSADHGWPDDDGFVDVVVLDCLCLPVGDLERATAFYGRLFGFARLWTDGGAGCVKALLGRAGRARLVLAATEAEDTASRLTAVVADLDHARETVWELGLRVARDINDAGRRETTARRRSFVMRDPDGHEIELIEQNRQPIDRSRT